MPSCPHPALGPDAAWPWARMPLVLADISSWRTSRLSCSTCCRVRTSRVCSQELHPALRAGGRPAAAGGVDLRAGGRARGAAAAAPGPACRPLRDAVPPGAATDGRRGEARGKGVIWSPWREWLHSTRRQRRGSLPLASLHPPPPPPFSSPQGSCGSTRAAFWARQGRQPTRQRLAQPAGAAAGIAVVSQSRRGRQGGATERGGGGSRETER